MSLVYIVIFIKNKESNPTRKILLIYFILNIILLGLIFKAGSSIFYLVEFTVSAILIGGVGTCSLIKKLKNCSAKSLPFLLFIPVLLFLSLTLPWFDKSSSSPHMGTLLDYKKLLSVLYSEDMEIFERMKNTQGRILSEDISYLLLCGKDPEWNPFITAQLHKGGIVSDELIRREIRQKKFSCIFLSFYLAPINGRVNLSGSHVERFTKDTFQDILKNYKIVPDKSYTKITNFSEPKTFLYPR